VDPDRSPTWSGSASCQVAADLCVALEPRYHLFGTADLFYARAPFATLDRGHVCRCIGLGKVGSKEKHRKWLHALSLSPMAQMTKEELDQLPQGSTPCPFAATAPHGMKRSAQEAFSSERGPRLEPEEKERRVKLKMAEASGPPSQKLLEAMKANDSGHALGQLEESLRKVSSADCAAALPAAVSAVLLAQEIEVAVAKEKAEAREKRKAEKEEKEKLAAEAVAKATADVAAEGERLRRLQVAKNRLGKPPDQGLVRYTFREQGALGLKFSGDVPPEILEVKDNSYAQRKDPHIPIGGVIHSVNGLSLLEVGVDEAMEGLKHRPVVIDVLWPDSIKLPERNSG